MVISKCEANNLISFRLSSYGQYVIMLTTMFVTLVKVNRNNRLRCNMLFYYMAGSASGQDEANPVL